MSSESRTASVSSTGKLPGKAASCGSTSVFGGALWDEDDSEPKSQLECHGHELSKY